MMMMTVLAKTHNGAWIVFSVLEKPQVQRLYHAALGPDGGDQNQTMHASKIIDLDECENDAI
jgi:hypothetical protein